MKIEEMTVGEGKEYLYKQLRTNKAKNILTGVISQYDKQYFKDKRHVALQRILMVATFMLGILVGVVW